LKVIEGGYKKGVWMHDPDIDDETLELIWHPKREKPELKRVK